MSNYTDDEKKLIADFIDYLPEFAQSINDGVEIKTPPVPFVRSRTDIEQGEKL